MNRQAQQGQETIRGLLGRGPETLAADVAGPAAPATGLMADPGDPRKQLEFMAGVMGLGRRERAAAGQLFEGIMGRASQANLTREGWGRQESAAALHEVNVDRRWSAEQERIDAQFQATNGLHREQFEADKTRWGEQAAFERYKFQQQQALAWRQDARETASNNRAAALASRGEDYKLSPGYERVIVQGANGPQVVARPVQGTPDWIKAQEGVDQLALARENIAKFQASLKAHGTEQVGAGAGEQKQLWSRVMASIGKLDELGTLQAGDLERLKEELPDPTAIMRGPLSIDRMHTALTGLDTVFQSRERQASERYRGWGLTIRDPRARPELAGGRDAPPPGSRPMGR
jgi:hypothetical protein